MNQSNSYDYLLPSQSLDALMMKALFYSDEDFTLSVFGNDGDFETTDVIEANLTCFFKFDPALIRKFDDGIVARREYYALKIFANVLEKSAPNLFMKLRKFFQPGVKAWITKDIWAELEPGRSKAMFSIKLTLPGRKPELLDKIIDQAIKEAPVCVPDYQPTATTIIDRSGSNYVVV